MAIQRDIIHFFGSKVIPENNLSLQHCIILGVDTDKKTCL